MYIFTSVCISVWQEWGVVVIALKFMMLYPSKGIQELENNELLYVDDDRAKPRIEVACYVQCLVR